MHSLITKSALAVASLGLLALAGSAGAQQDFVRNTQTSTKACFDTQRLEGYAPVKIGDHDGVNLASRPSGVFQMEFVGACNDLRVAQSLRIRSRDGSRYICSGSEADVIVVGGHEAPARCQVSGLRKLSDAEIAALPAQARP